MACSCGCCRQSTRMLSPQLETPVRISPIVSLPVAPIGELRGVIYRAIRAPYEVPKTYIHFFENLRPLLATDPAGSRLYILGGSFYYIFLCLFKRRFSSFNRRILACSGLSLPFPRNACPSSDSCSLIQRASMFGLIFELRAASALV